MADLLDNCRFTAGSSGTADFVDGPADPTFRNLEDAGAEDGKTYPYKAQNATGTEWEIGRGMALNTSGGWILERTTIQDSSNGGSLVNFGAAPKVIITAGKKEFGAETITYDPTDSGLFATDVQGAVDEVASKLEVATVSAAEALTPVSAPDFIRTAGFASAGDGGGALYRNVGSSEPGHDGKFKITLADGVTEVWFELAVSEIDVRQFGATVSGSQSASNRTGAMQAALAVGAAIGAPVLIPAGEWVIDEPLYIPSNARVVGAGMDVTTVKMHDAVACNVPVFVTGTLNAKRENIAICDLTLDYNADRWENPSDDSHTHDSNKALAIVYSERVWVDRVRVLDARGYGIDVTSPLPTNEGVTNWNAEPSRFVWVTDCIVSGAGDDCFTSRQSSDIFFTRCWASDTARNAGGISNGFEIDDGSRNVVLTDCVAARCEAGFQIKGHDGAPAAYNVVINNGKAVNCCVGLQIRNAGFTTTTETTYDDVPGLSEQFSMTAVGITVNGFQVIAPKAMNEDYTTPVEGMDIHSYTNVMMSNIVISDGREDLDNLEYEAADEIEAAIRLRVNARRVSISGLVINGFPTSPLGLVTNSSVGGADQRVAIHLDRFIVRDGPKVPLQIHSSVKDVYIGSYFINGRHGDDDGIGLNIGGTPSDDRHIHIGVGRIHGYETQLSIGGVAFDVPVSVFPQRMHIIDNDGALAVGNNVADHPASNARLKTYATGSRAGIATRANATSTRIHCAFEDTSGLIGSITSASGVMTYGGTSDARLKKDLEPLTDGLHRLLQIPVYRGRMNVAGENTPLIDMFLAHEVQQVAPHAVIGDAGAVDGNGNIIPQQLDASKLIPLLVQAVQYLAKELKLAG